MLTLFIGSAGTILLYGIAMLLEKHGDVFRHPKVTETAEITALVLAVFAGVEFVAASLGRVIDRGVGNLAGLIPDDAGSVILFLIAAFMIFKVVKALLKKAEVSLPRGFSAAVLLGAFPPGTWPAVIYGYLTSPADWLTNLILSHI